jgi:hypothetical protein
VNVNHFITREYSIEIRDKNANSNSKPADELKIFVVLMNNIVIYIFKIKLNAINFWIEIGYEGNGFPKKVLREDYSSNTYNYTNILDDWRKGDKPILNNKVYDFHVTVENYGGDERFYPTPIHGEEYFYSMEDIQKYIEEGVMGSFLFKGKYKEKFFGLSSLWTTEIIYKRIERKYPYFSRL